MAGVTASNATTVPSNTPASCPTRRLPESEKTLRPRNCPRRVARHPRIGLPHPAAAGCAGPGRARAGPARMIPLHTLAGTAAASPLSVRQLWQSAADYSGSRRRCPSASAHAFGNPVLGRKRTRVSSTNPTRCLAGAALRYGEAFLALDIAREGRAALELLLRQPGLTLTEVRAGHNALSHLGHVEALALARTRFHRRRAGAAHPALRTRQGQPGNRRCPGAHVQGFRHG